MRHFLEHQVADHVAMAVVDRFEAVEVDHQDGQPLPVACGAGHRRGHRVVQCRAVGQAGEQVARRQTLHAVLGVEKEAAGAGEPAGQTTPQHDAQQQRTEQRSGADQGCALLELRKFGLGGLHGGGREFGGGGGQQMGVVPIPLPVEDRSCNVRRAHGHRLEGRLAHARQLLTGHARLLVEPSGRRRWRQRLGTCQRVVQFGQVGIVVIDPAARTGGYRCQRPVCSRAATACVEVILRSIASRFPLRDCAAGDLSFPGASHTYFRCIVSAKG
ncbi:MAG: hypothetical protein ABL900_09150, partial [Burkholderiaceae bacterium]